MDNPLSITRIVAKYSRLKQLADKTRALRHLSGQLRDIVDQPLSGHVEVAALHDGCLVIKTDSAAWASQLRYKTPEIIARLGTMAGFETIKSIRIRVAPQTTGGAERQPSRPTITPAAAKAVDQQAASIGDMKIRSALQRLVRRARKA